jgi:hypothetical protein
MRVPRGKLPQAVHEALRNWYQPTGVGLDIFSTMVISRDYGLIKGLPIVDRRIAVNNLLSAYIAQLGRLQPILAQILTRRFMKRETAKEIAQSLNVTHSHLNRQQRKGIIHIAELVYDDESRRREKRKN